MRAEGRGRVPSCPADHDDPFAVIACTCGPAEVSSTGQRIESGEFDDDRACLIPHPTLRHSKTVRVRCIAPAYHDGDHDWEVPDA